MIVIAMLLFGGMGFFLDKWLHTSPWLMIGLGIIGFVAGMMNMIRRVTKPKPSQKNGNDATRP